MVGSDSVRDFQQGAHVPRYPGPCVASGALIVVWERFGVVLNRSGDSFGVAAL